MPAPGEERSLSASRGRPRSSAADAAILAAAVELFAEKGVEGATLDEVSRRAKVSRSTIYRRWSSKEQLLAQALGRMRDGDNPPVRDWAQVDADGFMEIMLDVVPDLLARPELARVFSRLLGSALSHPQIIRAYVDGYLAPRRAAFHKAVQGMQAAGRLRKDVDPDVFQDMISGALTYRLLLSGEPRSREAWQDYCRKLLHAAGLA